MRDAVTACGSDHYALSLVLVLEGQIVWGNKICGELSRDYVLTPNEEVAGVVHTFHV
jgi:hypothetical protein